MEINEYFKKLNIADRHIKNCVYCAYNILNNKIYIGYTQTTLDQRIRSHYHMAKWKNRSNNFFKNALARYNKNDFHWYILYENKEINELKEKEKYFIKLFKSNNRTFGYNLTDGGEQCHFNKEVITKISEKAKERNITKERNPFFKKHHSKRQRNIWSKSRTNTRIGEDNFSAKLTNEKVEQIKFLLWENILTQKEIGKMFGVCRMTICDINNNKSWNK